LVSRCRPAAARASAGAAYVAALVAVERLAFPADVRVVWSFVRRAP
jgi:hypothetical protein